MVAPVVPFTNNLAEQALRMARPQMKISGCFRTRAGAERFAHMWGLAETARKQGPNSLTSCGTRTHRPSRQTPSRPSAPLRK